MWLTNIFSHLVGYLFTLLIIGIGLLVNNSWYKKHDKKLSDVIIPLADEDLFIIIMIVAFAIIIFLFPVLNILVALSIDIGLFIKGVD